jgi:hypothetical protein
MRTRTGDKATAKGSSWADYGGEWLTGGPTDVRSVFNNARAGDFTQVLTFC